MRACQNDRQIILEIVLFYETVFEYLSKVEAIIASWFDGIRQTNAFENVTDFSDQKLLLFSVHFDSKYKILFN